MDPHISAWYGVNFENAFLKAKGDAFQIFFERLMSRAYKADFMARRPWGNVGDKKNDGFLNAERRLFQVYAPNEMTGQRRRRKSARTSRARLSIGASTSTSGRSFIMPVMAFRPTFRSCCWKPSVTIR